VLAPDELAFADYSGNRQYITVGNLAENDRMMLLLLDYAARTRLKVWGRGAVIDDDPALLERVRDPGYKAHVERAIRMRVEAWDTNCPQHIPQKFDAADVAQALAMRDGRIAELEAELAASKGESVPTN